MQWHQLDHMQTICTLLQIDNYVNTSSLNFFTGWMLFLTSNQQCQSTEGTRRLQISIDIRYAAPWLSINICRPRPSCSKPAARRCSCFRRDRQTDNASLHRRSQLDAGSNNKSVVTIQLTASKNSQPIWKFMI